MANETDDLLEKTIQLEREVTKLNTQINDLEIKHINENIINQGEKERLQRRINRLYRGFNAMKDIIEDPSDRN